MKLISIDIGQYMGVYNGETAHTEWLGKEHRHVRMSKFLNFLTGYLVFEAPDIVAYERPFDRGQHAKRSGWGYAGIIEAVATDVGAAVLDPHNKTCKKHFYPGVKSVTKEMMIAKAKELTGLELDEHSADAVCLWHYTNDVMEVIPA